MAIFKDRLLLSTRRRADAIRPYQYCGDRLGCIFSVDFHVVITEIATPGSSSATAIPDTDRDEDGIGLEVFALSCRFEVITRCGSIES
jgi:hypothetical protein